MHLDFSVSAADVRVEVLQSAHSPQCAYDNVIILRACVLRGPFDPEISDYAAMPRATCGLSIGRQTFANFGIQSSSATSYHLLVAFGSVWVIVLGQTMTLCDFARGWCCARRAGIQNSSTSFSPRCAAISRSSRFPFVSAGFLLRASARTEGRSG